MRNETYKISVLKQDITKFQQRYDKAKGEQTRAKLLRLIKEAKKKIKKEKENYYLFSLNRRKRKWQKST